MNTICSKPAFAKPAWFRAGLCCAVLLSFMTQTAADQAAPPELSVRENVVALPQSDIRPGGKAVFSLAIDDNQPLDKILLRFEAVLRHETEAGYASAARITVNGTTLDDSNFPTNWGKQRTWSLPNLNSKTPALFAPKTKTWTTRYDNDGHPPVKSSRYYSPELEDKYVYMFPVGKLLRPGKNSVTVENTSKQYTLMLLSPMPGKPGRIEAPRAVRASDSSIELAWKSDLQRFEIDYRAAGEKKWQKVANIMAWENPYNIVGLRPGTKYEFRIRGPFQPTADLHGKVLVVKTVESPVMTAETLSTPRVRPFSGMKLMPTRPMPGGLRYYPCVESHGGFLWVIDGGLRLIKLKPDTFEMVFKRAKPLAGWPMKPPAGYMGIPDTTVMGDKLWVTYNVQPSTRPGYTIDKSRQYVLSYDFATDKVSESIVVEPTRAKSGTWEGGIQAWRGKLWVMHMDAWREGPVRRTRIVLRTLEDGKFGPPIIYDNCPTVYPYGPSISVFDDKLVFMFSDLSGDDSDVTREPLLYTVFDGQKFSQAITIQNKGRSRYAKGVQIGDRFICAYKCSAPYYEKYGYNYHDIAVSIFTPGDDAQPKTVMYVDDRKYNSSPDVCLHGDQVIVVYNKIEHLYGKRDNPAVFHGDYIGKIVPR